ncbi:hypothetical protein HDU87_005432 [Geranomyces variabilis]|uniref:Uncharacterized protein n=1 Tax=Geranomyces variabilis TaxID=109894 RepID=A0AAD5THK3_9FUNG|nr:hypothetical protein HDU87_005432 [Geranomyces variabilis]
MTASVTAPLAPSTTPPSLVSETAGDRNDPGDINVLRTRRAVTNSPFQSLMRTRQDKPPATADHTTGEKGIANNSNSPSAAQEEQQRWKAKTATSASATRPNAIRKNLFVLADRGANAAAAADGSSDDDSSAVAPHARASQNQHKHSPKRQLADSISVAKHGTHWRAKQALPSVEMWERAGVTKVAKVPTPPPDAPSAQALSSDPPATANAEKNKRAVSESKAGDVVEDFWPILKDGSPKTSSPSKLSKITPASLSLPPRDTVKMPAAAEGDFGARRGSSSASIEDAIKLPSEPVEYAAVESGELVTGLPMSRIFEPSDSEKQHPAITENVPPCVAPESALLHGDGAPEATSRVPHFEKIAMRRVWSPSRLQVPSFSAGSIFDDPDWMQAFMPPVPTPTPPVQPDVLLNDSRKPVAAKSPCVPPRPSLPPEEAPAEKHFVAHGPPGGAPRRRDSLGHDFEPELASLANSLDEGFEDDPKYHFHTLTRPESLGSLVDDIMGRPPRQRSGKTVRFGRAWNGELESRRLLFASPEPDAMTYEGRIGVLYLQMNRLCMQHVQPTAFTEVTINIRQHKAERLYEREITRLLPPGVTTLELDFDCEIPLLPTHPVSLVFYVKTLSEDRSSPSPPSPCSLPNGATPVQPGSGCAPAGTRPAHGRKNSLISFFRSKRPEDGSLTPPPPRPPPKRSGYGNGAKDAPPQLTVAESDPFRLEQWTALLDAASGNLVDYVFTARLLEWKNALVHGAAIGSAVCRMGFLPFLDSRMHRALWPKRVQDYAMGVRVAEWNEALSMEGYLWQLGGDVRTSGELTYCHLKMFQRRYYKLHGPLLSVYAACSNPRVTDVPWEEYDFDPDTQLPLPLEQSHGANRIATIELANLESWCSYEKPRARQGSVTVPDPDASNDAADGAPSLGEHERTMLPTPSAAVVLLFKDGREIILGVDPDEVGRYQRESDRFATTSSSDSSGQSLRQVKQSSASQLTHMQWRPLDIADMWKQAFNEVLNGVKYDIPVWVQPLKDWRANGGTIVDGQPAEG